MRTARTIAVFIVVALLVAAGCSGVKAHNSRASKYNASHVVNKLNAQLAEWRGTRYRIGGLSKSGIDCSGFVHITFKNKFGLVVPRTTRGLAGHGRKVRRDHLRAGDIVLFKTGIRKRHAGIYIGGGDFIHASTSNGVMQSSLENGYWEDKYWQARRIPEFL